MSSSTNPFPPLGSLMSSSTNHQVLLAENARLSAELITNTSTIRDLQQRIRVLEQVIVANEVEKRLPLSTSSTSNEKHPSYTTPLQALYTRRSSFDETGVPSKLHDTDPPSSSWAAQELVAAAPATTTRDIQPAWAFVVQEYPPLISTSPFYSTDVRNPRKPFLCIVQVNDEPLIGSFTKTMQDWTIQIALNVNGLVDPTMTMVFFSKGLDGPQSAETRWCLSDMTKGGHTVTDFKIFDVLGCVPGGRINRDDIQLACLDKANDSSQIRRLVCISLEARPHNVSYFDEDHLSQNPQPAIESLYSAMFTGRDPYHLYIWFIAPYEIGRFNKQCLAAFTACIR